MNRIDKRFADLKAKGRKAFVAYITAGDPSLESTVNLVGEFDRQGVDIVELGVPFSDPVADGPVNQEASMRALANGVTVEGIFGAVREIRRTSEIPLIFFAYYNTILSYGLERFVKDAFDSGLDGALVLDLPPEEAGLYKTLMDKAGLATIFLVSPITPEARLKRVASFATGFVYYVTQLGVTGERDAVAADISDHIRAIRSFTDTPIVAGFGISTPAQVIEASKHADGVVVGSSIVRRIGVEGTKKGFEREIGSFVGSLTTVLKGEYHG